MTIRSASTPTLPWLAAGYQTFALEGPLALKVEGLARAVGKSKSSFYHHFADMEGFVSQLLDIHIVRCQEIAIRERACKTIDPELIVILVEVREDLLFHRQLRIHRDLPDITLCLSTATEIMEGAFLELWARELELQAHPSIVQELFAHAIENFFLTAN